MNINKLKINPGVASILLLAAYLLGGSTLFTVAIFIFCFCEVDDKIQNTAVKVFTFFIGITIVSVGWNIIISAVGLLLSAVNKAFSYLNTNFDVTLDYIKIMTPITDTVDIVDNVVKLLIKVADIGFVISVISNKPGKSTPISGKIDEFVNNALNYVQSITNGPIVSAEGPSVPAQGNNLGAAPAPAPAAPAPQPGPVAPAAPTPTAAPVTPVNPQQ